MAANEGHATSTASAKSAGSPERFKPLAVAIDEGNECNRDLENSRQFRRDPVENFFRRAIGRMQRASSLEAFFLVVRDRAGNHPVGDGDGKLR